METEFRRGPAEYEKERCPEGKVELEPRRKLHVGVTGDIAKKFNASKAQDLIVFVFDMIERKYPDHEIWIVSGYTDLGIPGLVYREAVRRGWKTFGIACKRVQDYKVFPCDEVRIVGNEWGDESPTFLATCRIFIRFGGGRQSHIEIEQAKANGKITYEYELELYNS